MASQKEIERSIKRMTEKRSKAVVPSDKKPQISGKAFYELVQHMKDLNSFRARSLSASANRVTG